MRFMVVDDSEIIRLKISEVLSAEDFEIVGTAKNGVEAIEQFKIYRPAIMTMDITMPMMDGIETIQRIVEMDKEVRILVVSALADKATLLKAMSLGAYGFLCKPFNGNTLADAIEELIEGLVDE
ncbi:MAG: two-component system chemotaxis response regulator CheY [Cellvibrionaceae bacterium]|jgi:two-component system chemotaxis response regulator CheY